MMKGVDTNWGSFFSKLQLHSMGKKKEDDGNILTLTPIVQA